MIKFTSSHNRLPLEICELILSFSPRLLMVYPRIRFLIADQSLFLCL